MLVVENVSKKYGKFVANENVNLVIQPGEISILLGPNGAGKSTIIKCIAGLLKFDGIITINGYGNKSMEAKKLLGYVPEMPALYDMLTVWEHLEFIGRAYKLTDWKEDAEKLLKRFELDDKKSKLGKELSKGMQQKVSICCALLPKPSVILFDEPMVGLDPHGIKELKNLIIEKREEGAAVLISTHMLDSVADFWDSANIMVESRIATHQRRYEGMKTDELEDIFFQITETDKSKVEGVE